MKTFYHQKLHVYPHKYQRPMLSVNIFDKIKTKVILGKLHKGHKFIIIYKIVFPENSKKKNLLKLKKELHKLSFILYAC